MPKEKPKNIQISLVLFRKIIMFMELCDITDCTPELQQLFQSIFSELIAKQESIELRNAYSKVAFATDEKQKKDALAAYVEKKELKGI